MLDAQRGGCIPEYEDIDIPKCHPLYDRDCRAERFIPFRRSRYDFDTGFEPNRPRDQLNEITPWLDGTLVYGPLKAWADRLRTFGANGTYGALAALGGQENIAEQYPVENNIGLPFANPPPPANRSLFTVDRFNSKCYA